MENDVTPVLAQNIEATKVPPVAEKPTGIEGSPADSSHLIWKSPDGSIETGIWECTPGVFTTARNGVVEVVHILAGKGFFISKNGERTDYEAGDAVVLNHGFDGQWHVVEHTKKIYFTAPTKA